MGAWLAGKIKNKIEKPMTELCLEMGFNNR